MTTPVSSTEAKIAALVAERGIREILHFTTNKGLVGILARRMVLSRKQLPEESYLEHVYTPNCRDRKDPAWLDYVSLSISRINDWMFDCSKRWHTLDDVWWAVLAFEPSVLADPGVHFATTNNIYPSVLRARGVTGIEWMFADVVYGRYRHEHRRQPDMPASWPTDRQAEVLYPHALGIDRLRCIYVAEPEHADIIAGMVVHPQTPDVPVRSAPEVFA